MKIDMTAFALPWEDFAECFQRRHVIVHNGGQVSRQYLERVDQDWIERHKEEAQLEKVLQVNEEYLVKAFDSFELVGSLLCQECWKRFARDERHQRGVAFSVHQFDCVVDAKWIVAERLGSWAVSEGDTTASHALVARINRWLSIKRQNRWSEIEAEVKGFDYSVLDSRYVAAIHALMGNTDLFLQFCRRRRFQQTILGAGPFWRKCGKTYVSRSSLRNPIPDLSSEAEGEKRGRGALFLCLG